MPEMFAGLLTGLSLIVAIGAQGMFVLRQALLRRYVGVIVSICIGSDMLLITAGVVGVGAVVTAQPGLLAALRWAGAAYLTGYGLRGLWRARAPGAVGGPGAGSGALRRVIGAALAVTYLNPHVYLDTVVLLGSLANQHGGAGRWWFAAGATMASVVWFSAIGGGARVVSRAVRNRAIWRVIELTIALVMIALAVGLLLP